MLSFFLLVCTLLVQRPVAHLEPEAPEDRFFIYDWPSLHGRSSWPLPDTILKTGVAAILDYKHIHSLNHGAGEMVNVSLGMYSTNPYHLYQLIMSRLFLHPLRTLDRSKATLFFVPYDIGVVSQWDPHTGVYKMHQAGGCSAASDEVVALLQAAVTLSPLDGHDHVLINSMFGLLNFNCYKIMAQCRNCARLTSEPSRARLPLDYSASTAFYKYASKRNITVPYGTFGVPIPASVHYSDEMKEYPWSDWEVERHILVTGWFAMKVQNYRARRYRADLFRQCSQHFDKCAFIEILERSGHQSKTVPLLKTSYAKVHSTTSRPSPASSFQNGYDFYRHSTFCLHPPGDMEMRKGVFDSILLGCIPVLLLPHILSRKYPWFFSKETERAVSINVHLSAVTNIVSYLESIPAEVVQQKRRALAELAPTLSYSLPPQRQQQQPQTWQPPFRDAVDVLLRALFQRVRRFRASGGAVPPGEALLNITDGSLYWRWKSRGKRVTKSDIWREES